MSEDILELITEATSKGNYKEIGRMVRKARRSGFNDEEIIKSLSAGLTDVSKKYKTKGMYLDDIIKAAGAFEVGIQSLGISEISNLRKKSPYLHIWRVHDQRLNSIFKTS